MTDEQINAVIALECGWTNVSVAHRSGKAPGADYVGSEFISNYCHDLNAIHEAERMLQNQFTPMIEETYWRNLQLIKPHPIYATARQKAEAFLRALGKWEEGQ